QVRNLRLRLVSLMRPPPGSPLFPYTTLFRSSIARRLGQNRAVSGHSQESPLTDAQPVLRGHALEVWRGHRCLFEGLDFTVEPGQLALVLGPNGSGKTTLLRTLAGLSPPTAGRVTLDGVDDRSLDPASRARLAYNGHLDGLKRELTLEENLQFYASLHGNGAE